MNTLVSLVRDEDGATMVEYAFILALIAVVCVAVVTALGTKVKNSLTGASNGMP